MNKLSAAIALSVVTQVSSLEAGVFSFLTGKGRSQGNQVTTSAGSKAEAKVDKNGSIVRVGSNTTAKVSDNGTVTLSKGVMLVSSGEGFLRRPPVQISTPQGDVTVRGSAIVAALPDGSVKMTVLEGNAKGMMGDRSMALNPGQLMIQRHQSRDAVNVDLGALASSSTLLDNSQYQLPLPATPIIRQEVVDQAQAIGSTLTLSGANQNGATQVENAAELKLVRNGSSVGAVSGVHVSGATLQLGSADYLSSATLSLNGAGSTPGGPLTFNTSPTFAGGGGPSGTGLTISGSSIVYSPGGNSSAFITDNLGNPLPGAGSIRFTQTLVPEGTVLTPTTNLSSGVSSVGMGSSLQAVSNNFFSSYSSANSGSLVLAPGITQTGGLIINGSSLALSSSAVVTLGGTTSSLVRSGAGSLALGGTNLVISGRITLSFGSTAFSEATVLNSGSLVLRDAAAQQFLSGGMTVVGPGGVVLTPTSDNGVLTFQVPGSTTIPTTPPATVP